MCSLTPSVTLYGTTQVPTVRTITHSALETVPGDPVISLLTIQTTECDAFGQKCGPQFVTSLVTVTPSLTTTVFSLETKTTIATNVIPQQTLFYPCSFAPTSEIQGVGGGEEARETSTRAAIASTFDSAVPAPPAPTTTSSSSTTVALSASASALASAIGVTTSIEDQAQPIRSDRPIPSDQSFYPASSVLSSISTSINSTQTGAAGTTQNVSSKSSNGPAIAGGIAGGILGLLLFCVAATYLRRSRRNRADQASVADDNYWERHFRALEAEGDGTIFPSKELNSPDSDNSPDHLGPAGAGKKLRLTLDLQSKGMSNRPASRLSMISSFFAKPQPVPFQARSSRGPLNFSRPRFGHKRQSSKTSGVSGGKSVKSKRGSRAPSVKSLGAWLSGIARGQDERLRKGRRR